MSQIRTWKHAMFLGIAILLWVFSAALAFAQEPEPITCGYFDYGLYQQPVEDCNNPFGKTSNIVDFYIEGQLINDGDTVVAEEAVHYYGLPGYENWHTNLNMSFYRHQAEGFVYVDTAYEKAPYSAFLEFIKTIFPDNIARAEYYATIFAAENDSQYFYEPGTTNRIKDPYTGENVVIVYSDLYDLVYENVEQPRGPLEYGTYTAVLIISNGGGGPVMTSFTDKVFNWLVPTVYADEVDIRTITFTIAEELPVLEGPSSVLFLPGIMGSRLYEESAECNPYDDVSYEQTRWPSAGDCDIARLGMSSLGVSVNDIFTGQEGGVVDDIYAGVNIYESLLEDFEQWKVDGDIADYRAVPYDWRLSLYDILKAKEVDGRIIPDSSGTYQDGYVYKSLVALVEESPAEKVVLVGHSNGGLVIQALLAAMKANDDPLIEAIDKVVLVAVPQLGAPESVVGLLHGVQLAGGFVISHEESRKLMNTSPFAYHLLPSEEYYDTVATPVVTFEPGTSTDPWIAQFGSELDSLEEVTAFLAKESGRTTPEWGDTATPATAYSHLLGYGESVHEYLQGWRPTDTKVYEVGGIGIYTPATLTYFTDFECVRIGLSAMGQVLCAESAPKLGYQVFDVIDGDGTIVTPSALVSQGDGVEKWWVNLKEYDTFTRNGRAHKDILEVLELREFVSDILASSTLDSYTFLSTSIPDFSGENRILLRLHSPLDMFVVLHDGEVVGSSTPSLRGVEYRRYGEVQQLSIPEDEENYEIRLVGLSGGSFTLEIEQYVGDDMEERVTYSALPTSTSTQVIVDLEDEELLNEVELLIDYEGDGVFETTAQPGLSRVTFVEPEVVASTSTSAVVENSGSTGTKVKNRGGFATAPVGLLSAATVYTTEQELLLQLIALLTQYRDLLIKLRVQ